MTDEDERMDRARRIREMREGSRPDQEEQADDRGGPDAGTDGGPDAGTDAEPDEGTTADETDMTPGDERSETAGTGTEQLEADEGGDTGGDGESTLHIPSTEVEDVEVDVEEMARKAGIEAVDDESNDGQTGEDESTESVSAVPGVDEGAEPEHTGTEETRVLEFSLGPEQYCLDIEYVEEIVKRETVTRVPNTPECVEGVVDLRGQITTILDPKVLLDIDAEGNKDLIVVFDPDRFDDHGAIGWVVDDVDRVMPVTEDEVNTSPVNQSHINGVVDRDGQFVIWTTPELDVEEMVG